MWRYSSPILKPNTLNWYFKTKHSEAISMIYLNLWAFVVPIDIGMNKETQIPNLGAKVRY